METLSCITVLITRFPTSMKNLFPRSSFLLTCLLFSTFINSQQRSISVSYGRFWAAYDYIDEGTGFKNAPRSNWSNYPTVSYNSPLTPNADLEYFFTYARYAQYFSTNRHPGAFYSNYGVGYLGVHYAHAVLREAKTELRIKGGVAIGIMPDQYEGTFESVFVYPYTDSITRGTINRSFTPIFPMVSGGMDLTQKVNMRLGISLQIDYCQGFSRITEYDIYYNNGSGRNDQHARQWGKGSYIGFQVGVKYYLK